MRRVFISIALVALFVGGCSQSGSSPRTQGQVEGGYEPLSLQLVRTDEQMRKYPFLTLLDFELPNDPVFVRAEGGPSRPDTSKAHTGATSLLLEGSALTVRLPSLVRGTEFPGRWTLMGMYVHPATDQRMTAAYEVEGQTLTSVNVAIPGNRWTPVLLDLSSATEAAKGRVGLLKFTFANPGQVWCDNVVVIDNDHTHVSVADAGWSVSERGFTYIIERPLAFRAVFKMPEAIEGGWTLKEANAVRVRLESSGKEKSRVIYSDGREVLDGRLRALTRRGQTEELLSQQHSTPATVTVGADQGRLDRNSPGDTNNDGYNEMMGTYQLIGSGPRMELRIVPRTQQLIRPVLHISGLAEGKVLATMEGRLIEHTVRLEDGAVLIELPGSLERATTINVRLGQ